MQFFVLYPKYPFSANLAQKYQNCQFKLKFEYINMYLIYLKCTEYLVPVLISYSLITLFATSICVYLVPALISCSLITLFATSIF